MLVLLLALLFLNGCGHRKQAKVNLPPTPPIADAEQPAGAQSSDKVNQKGTTSSGNTKNNRSSGGNKGVADPDLHEPSAPRGAKPLMTETGLASWYGPPYHNRRGSNGEVYNMNAMTAAHRTLPLGSIVRVTNVKTRHSVLVRITDRGPFIPGRIVDLSLAAARKIDVVQPGVAEVKVELVESWPADIVPPKSYISTAPSATGGYECASSTTTASAHNSWLAKPTHLKVRSSW